eukprot:5019295-Prymnesium_polylepis.2
MEPAAVELRRFAGPAAVCSVLEVRRSSVSPSRIFTRLIVRTAPMAPTQLASLGLWKATASRRSEVSSSVCLFSLSASARRSLMMLSRRSTCSELLSLRSSSTPCCSIESFVADEMLLSSGSRDLDDCSKTSGGVSSDAPLTAFLEAPSVP